MSGTGPVEPGEGTRAWDVQDAATALPSGRAHGRPASLYTHHRRAVLATATAAALLTAGGYLYATRPRQPAPPEAPYPAQAVEVGFLTERVAPPGSPPRSFSFTVLLRVLSGPPVTVTRVTQPYAGLSLVTEPRAPFRTKAGTSRKITITMHVTECRSVPRNAGLPFLDVTLRNTRAIQVQSFILGPSYAQHLSEAIEVACGSTSA